MRASRRVARDSRRARWILLRSGRSYSHVAADIVEEPRMRLTVRSILLLIAVVLFVLAAVGIDLGNIALVPLGLAAFAAAFVVPDSVLSARR